PDRLEMEIVPLGAGPLLGDDFRAQGLESALVRNAGGVHVAREFHVAAQRQPGQAPLDAVLVGARDDRLAEADGEPVDADAEQTRDGEVAQLVDGDDQGQDQQERDDVSQGLAYEAQHAVLRLSTAQAARARCATTVVATRRASASTSRAISQATPAPLAAAPEPILARVSDATMAISRKPIRRSRKAWTPTSLAALNTAGLQPPAC